MPLAHPAADVWTLLADIADETPDATAFIHGEPVRSENLDRRAGELATAAASLQLRREELVRERKAVFENFEDEADFPRQYGLLGPVGAWLFSDRQWHQLRTEEWEQDRLEHRGREIRYLALLRALQELKGTHVVSCSLVWNEGYPVGGSSGLSRSVTVVARDQPS